jgi:hypothetical protein
MLKISGVVVQGELRRGFASLLAAALRTSTSLRSDAYEKTSNELAAGAVPVLSPAERSQRESIREIAGGREVFASLRSHQSTELWRDELLLAKQLSRSPSPTRRRLAAHLGSPSGRTSTWTGCTSAARLTALR